MVSPNSSAKYEDYVHRDRPRQPRDGRTSLSAEKPCPAESPVMVDVLSLCCPTCAAHHVWLWSGRHVAGAMEKLDFYVIF